MRVSTNMLTFNFMSSLNKSLERQNNLQEQLSDGKAIHRPSDDPVRAIRSLRFNINLKENEQYTQNVSDAISWMETTDGAMNDLSSLMTSAKELVIKSVSVNPDMAMDAIAKELDGLINKMVEIGNTKIGDRYIFAGQNDKIQPFQRRTVVSADGMTKADAVVYLGDSNKISMRIQSGVVAPAQDSVNLTGADVFGPLTSVKEQNGTTAKCSDMLTNLIKIKEALEGKTSSPNSNLSGGSVKQVSSEAHNPVTLKIEELDPTPPPTGRPSKVSYSTDGGQSWKAATVADNGTTPPSSRIKIPAVDMGTTNVVEYDLTASLNNQVGDNYTLPKINEPIQLAGGAAKMVSSESHKACMVRIDTVDTVGVPGQITGASYSVDGGQNWVPFAGADIDTTDPLKTRITIPANVMGTVNPVQYDIATSAKNATSVTYSFPQSSTDRDFKWLSKAGLYLIDSSHSRILQADTELGARMSMYEQSKALLEKNNVTITGDVSANEDLDIAKALIDFKTSETMYNAALSIGSKLLPPSLADFLR